MCTAHHIRLIMHTTCWSCTLLVFSVVTWRLLRREVRSKSSIPTPVYQLQSSTTHGVHMGRGYTWGGVGYIDNVSILEFGFHCLLSCLLLRTVAGVDRGGEVTTPTLLKPCLFLFNWWSTHCKGQV